MSLFSFVSVPMPTAAWISVEWCPLYNPLYYTAGDVRGKITPQLEECLRQAIKEQTSIGWKYSMRGILSRSWTQSQAIEHKVSIVHIHAYYVLGWTHQNNCLHKKTTASSKIKESVWDDKICTLYAKQHLFCPLQSTTIWYTIRKTPNNVNRRETVLG